jgi:hypothetical protein
MDQLSRLAFQSLLDAMDGIAYVTSPDDVILAYGRPNWERFALASSAAHLAAPGAVLGRRLKEFVTGPQAQTGHQAAVELMRSQQKSVVSYSYRCDAPDVRRDMRMSITPIMDRGALVGLLYHSITLREASRSSIALLAAPTAAASFADPVVSICSYCKCIRLPVEAPEPVWITPEEYYGMGHDDQGPVSHGICPHCWEAIVQPMMAELTALRAEREETMNAVSTGGSAL